MQEKLIGNMENGGYQVSGLTIAMLAATLDYPEHQLRKLINSRLGFRNFSAFLNSYRIPAAQAMLADPAKARTQVLAIALDVGFASIGPFNRAFRELTGVSPTTYRRKELSQSPAGSE